jgi:enoyl-CoA hydratase/carnithine racemase
VTTVEYDLDGHVAVIRFNRPEALNAMSTAMRAEFLEAFSRFTGDDEARVAILTGAGRAFCAGRDLKGSTAMASIERDDGKPPAAMYSSALNILGMPDTDKPIVAAVNGYAMGLGWYMVLDCDIRIAAVGAEFGMTEVPTGVLGPYFLSAVEGITWPIAAELALVGERVQADRLYELGVLNAVVPGDQLMAEARRWADKLAALPPLHVRRTKALMREMRRFPDADVLAREVAARQFLGELDDTREAVTAWQEKRPPVYRGR